MAKRKVSKSTSVRSIRDDLSSWNFVIFLTLAFILMVVVLSAIKNIPYDLRTKAGLVCPKAELPRAEDCAAGWTYKRDANGCLSFFCELK